MSSGPVHGGASGASLCRPAADGTLPARRHYEDCYETLVDMFATPALLTPRTKRWAEAKVLADCLTVKVRPSIACPRYCRSLMRPSSQICKMYLYLNEPARSVSQFNKHVARFRELSNTWGIGEQTFEFWSWLSKQCAQSCP